MEDRKRTSSGSEADDRYGMMDEKKRKRMISNRESARRSRMRRDQHMKDLNSQILFFNSKRNEMVQRINEVSQRYAAVESENRVLRAQKDELSKRLECAEIVSSYYVDVPPQNPWLNPWQPPPQSLPMVMTSAGNFHF